MSSLDLLSITLDIPLQKRGKDRKTFLNYNYIPKFICKYPKQMLWQMEFPRQLNVISEQGYHSVILPLSKMSRKMIT